MFKTLLRASLLLAPVVAAQAATSAADLDELHQRQFRYARAMMQLNQIEGFERGPSIDVLLRQEREERAKRAEERRRDPADVRAQSMDEFAKAVERVASDQRAKRMLPASWRINELVPAQLTVSADASQEACWQAPSHQLGVPVRLNMSEPGVVWLRVVAPSSGHWGFDTLISEFDTQLSVYRDCRDVGRLAPLVVSDDAVGLGSLVGLDIASAGEYRLIRIERKSGFGTLAIVKSALAQSISGRLTRQGSGAPLAGLDVLAIPVSAGSAMQVYVWSGEDGGYSITVYEPGSYYLLASIGNSPFQELVSEAYPDSQCAGIYALDYCAGAPMAVNVGSGGAVTGRDIALSVGAIATGQVTDQPTGEPLASAEVMLYWAEDLGENQTMRVAYSDVDGRFRVIGLRPGEWRVQYRDGRHRAERWNDVPCGDWGEGCQQGTGQPVAVVAGQVTRVDASLVPASYARFRVLSNGVPLTTTPVNILVRNAGGFPVSPQSSYSGTDGIAEVGPLPPGRYRFAVTTYNTFGRAIGGVECLTDCNAEFATAALIDIPGSATEPLQVDLRPLPAIEGVVTAQSTGQPLKGVRIFASGSVMATTDAQGRYRLAAMPVGTYRLWFETTGYLDEIFPNVPCDRPLSPSQCSGGQEFVIDLESPSLQVASEALVKSPGLSGQVDRAIPDGGSPHRILLERIDATGRVLQRYDLPVDGGRYVLDDVPVGTARWAARSYFERPQVYPGIECGYDVANQQYIGCAVSSGTLIQSVAEQDVTNVDFLFLPSGYRLVRVLDQLSLAPLGDVIVDQWTASGVWRGATRTSDSGWAQLQYYPQDGSPLLVSTDNTMGYTNEVYDNRACPPDTSAYFGGCALTGATPVAMTDAQGAILPSLLVQLFKDAVFSSGFE